MKNKIINNAQTANASMTRILAISQQEAECLDNEQHNIINYINSLFYEPILHKIKQKFRKIDIIGQPTIITELSGIKTHFMKLQKLAILN